MVMLWAGIAAAATVDLRMEPDNLVVGQSGTARVLVLTGRGEAGVQGGRPPPIPAQQGLRVAVAGQASQFRQVGGRITQVKQFDYRVTALEEGTWTVGPIELRLSDGTLVKTREVSVTVRERPEKEGGPDVVIAAGFASDTAWEGELVMYNYRMETRLPGASADWQLPEFDGLRQPHHGQPSHSAYVIEDPDGSISVEHGAVPLVAVATGTRDQGVAIAHVKMPTGPRSPFGFRPLRRDPYATDRAVLTIEPLPKPEPEGFSGLVGEFEIYSEVDKTSAAVGESVNWTVRIVGDGVLEGVGLPDYGVDGASIYDNDGQVIARVEAGRYEAVAAIRRVLVPTVVGTLQPPPMQVHTFDPGTGRYVAHAIELPPIEVTPGREGDGTVQSFGGDVDNAAPAETIEVDFRDIARWGMAQAWPLDRVFAVLGGLLAIPGFGVLFFEAGAAVRRRVVARRAAAPAQVKAASSWLDPLPSDPQARLVALDAALKAATEIHGDSDRTRALKSRVGRARFAGDLRDDAHLVADVREWIAAMEDA